MIGTCLVRFKIHNMSKCELCKGVFGKSGQRPK